MYYTNSLEEDQADQMDERQINFNHMRKRNYTEIRTLGFCICGRRITSMSNAWETKNGTFCEESGQACENKMLEELA